MKKYKWLVCVPGGLYTLTFFVVMTVYIFTGVDLLRILSDKINPNTDITEGRWFDLLIMMLILDAIAGFILINLE